MILLPGIVMTASALLKSVVVLALFTQASGFIASPISRTATGAHSLSPRGTAICLSAAKDDKKVAGVGGRNLGRLPSRAKGRDAARAPARKGAAPKTAQTKKAGQADIDWGEITLAFLTPWRNPNSIFLYLLIIVSVLGKINETPQ